MNPETERQALSVSSYVRRKPIDPYAEARDRVNFELRRDKGLRRWKKRLAEMDRDIALIVRRDCIDVSKEAR